MPSSVSPALATNPIRYIAILDGSGESYAQQFAIAALAEIMCVVIDHNSSDEEKSVDVARTEDHSAFMQQIRGYLSEEREKRAGMVHLLLNKSDLWELTSDDEKTNLASFFQEELTRWQQGNWAEQVTFGNHSNEHPNDIALFVGLLSEYIDTHYEQEKA